MISRPPWPVGTVFGDVSHSLPRTDNILVYGHQDIQGTYPSTAGSLWRRQACPAAALQDASHHVRPRAFLRRVASLFRGHAIRFLFGGWGYSGPGACRGQDPTQPSLPAHLGAEARHGTGLG